jgi:16S rRNA processing protein RimM
MLIALGKINGVFGIKGWVKIYSYTRPRERILEYSPWILELDGSRTELKVSDGQVHGKGLIARFEGIEDRNQAEKLVGAVINITDQDLPDTAADEYYWSQLVGLDVSTTQGIELGKVTHLFETGANDVMVVRGERERLIPFTRDAVIEVDLDSGKITVDWDPDF